MAHCYLANFQSTPQYNYNNKEMVQKNQMTADFEQLTYTAKLLKDSWEDKHTYFKLFASHGTVDHGMTDFISWIIQTNHSERLFAGSSMYRLLISKPKNGKLNYQQTLSISFDKPTGLYTMQYSDWDTIDHEKDYKDAIQWKSKCTGIELAARFLEFLEWNKSWNQ